MNRLKHIFVVGLVAAFAVDAHARPFGPDHAESEVCAAVASEREAPPNAPPAWLADVFEHPINRESGIDECSTAFVQREARLPASREKRPAAIPQPLSPKE